MFPTKNLHTFLIPACIIKVPRIPFFSETLGLQTSLTRRDQVARPYFLAMIDWRIYKRSRFKFNKNPNFTKCTPPLQWHFGLPNHYCIYFGRCVTVKTAAILKSFLWYLRFLENPKLQSTLKYSLQPFLSVAANCFLYAERTSWLVIYCGMRCFIVSPHKTGFYFESTCHY